MSSVQIAPTGEGYNYVDDNNQMMYMQLGDKVVIDSIYGRTVGRVYYRSLEMISIKPQDIPNVLQRFEFEDDDDEEVYKESDGVTSTVVIEKRIYESFVEQQDFRVGQLIDTFNIGGKLVNSYTITEVDKEKDMITIQDVEKKDAPKDVLFNFIGIEPDEDFAIISIRQFVPPRDEADQESDEQDAQQAQQAQQTHQLNATKLSVDGTYKSDQLELQQAQLQARMELDAMRVGAQVEKDKATLMANQEREGVRMGVEIAKARQQAQAPRKPTNER